MWEIEYKYVESWLDEQDDATVACIFAALELLQESGPTLGRPLVDSLADTTMSNLKELRPASPGNSEIRIIFAFDPNRKAVLLLGGDKSKGRSNKEKWSGWYRKAIPEAKRIYSDYLAEAKRAGGSMDAEERNE